MTSTNILPNGDIAKPWTYSTLPDHYDSINTDDASYIQAQGDDDIEIEEFSCSTFTLGVSKYITTLQLYIKAKDSGDSKALSAHMYYDGAWDTENNISVELTSNTTVYTATATGLFLDQDDLNAIKIKLTSDFMGAGETISVYYAKIIVTYETIIIQSDIIEGSITQSEMGYTKGEFKIKEGIDIDLDGRLKITEDYTSLSSTSSEVIFEGIIEDHSLADIKDINAVSKQDEVARIQPYGVFRGLTTYRLSKMIELFGDFISASYGPTTWTGYYDAIYNFSLDSDKIGEEINWVDDVYPYGSWSESDLTITTVDGHINVLTLNHDASGQRYGHWLKDNADEGLIYGSVEFWFRTTSLSGSYNIGFADGDTMYDTESFRCDISGTKFDFDGAGYTISINTWYRVRVDWCCDASGYKGLSADSMNLYLYNSGGTVLYSVLDREFLSSADLDYVNQIHMNNQTATRTFYIDAFARSWDIGYTLGDNTDEITYNLPISSKKTSNELSGGQTLQSLLTEGAITETDIWSLAPDGDVRWHDGSDSSGVILDGTQKVWDVTAKVQVKRINRVVLKGAGGLEAIKDDPARQATAGQIIIYQDYRADITNQTDLNTMAQSILDTKKNPPLRIQLSLEWEAKGWIQVGENIHIEENKIKYNNSSSYIPHDDYRIVSETYHIKNGAYHYIELTLDAGLSYIEQQIEDKVNQNMQNMNYSYTGGDITGGSTGGGINNIVEDPSPQLGGDLDLNGSNIDFPTTANISDCLDEDNMASNSATKLATQQSIKTYHDDNKTVAGDLSHNSLANLNVGDIYEHISQDQKDALHPQLTNLNELATRNHADLQNILAAQHHASFVQGDADALYSVLAHLHDARYYTETEVDDRIFEQSAAFPGVPSEGDFHYDEDDDSLYRYNAEAEAWIEIGTSGASTNLNFPIGAIIMFRGDFTNNVTIKGWYKCDGNNGTVNLIDKFVRGADTSGATGGSDDAVVVSHDHGVDYDDAVGGETTLIALGSSYVNHSHSPIKSEGVSGVGKNVPAYHALIYIERIS